MAKIGASYWISDVRARYALLSPWEKRSFIVASYLLADEGKHWRQHERAKFLPFALLSEIGRATGGSRRRGQYQYDLGIILRTGAFGFLARIAANGRKICARVEHITH